ncbi:hypothetical protein llh_7655 [Lactococcus cremoris subsp. cremoris A76]|nr:hypothetical protein llh_7655 [Lactococcus cremoris subsp. cremoris A76]
MELNLLLSLSLSKMLALTEIPKFGKVIKTKEIIEELNKNV